MGLMSFMEKAGKSIFNIGAQAAAKSPDQLLQERQEILKQHVASLGLNIQNLDVSFAGNGAIRLTGTAASRADAEKAALMAGNVTGINSVDNQIVVSGSDEAESGTYEVKSGDSLSKIAKEQMGDANAYMKIFEANKPMLKDPNEIYPGQVLRIPATA